MAEARVEEDEEELKEQREAGIAHSQRRSDPDPDRSGRHKPDQRHPSPGPLSSLRAAIKRTASSRGRPHSDATRDRRPEITILSAEPLTGNSWFLGPHGGFLAAPPPTPPIWGAGVPAAGQAPPSYDQVIKEKTQERVQPLDSRRHGTSTIATQTDLLPAAVTPGRESNVMSVGPPPVQLSKLRKPPRPPRPSLPTHLLPLLSRVTDIPATSQGETSDEHSDPDTHRVEALDCLLNFSGKPCADACAAEADAPELCLISLESLLDRSGPAPLSDSSADRPAKEEARCPVPRPRARQPIGKEVKVQTLVRLKDDGENAQLILKSGEDSTSKYLQELLEIFSPEEQSFPSSSGEQSKESELDMSALRAKIQAFEKQPDGSGVLTECKKPEPRRRAQQPRPPLVAPKPSLAPKPPSQKRWDGGLAAGPPAGADGRKESPLSSGPTPPVPSVSAADAKPQEAEASQPERRPSRPPVAPRSRSFTVQIEAGGTDSQVASSPDLMHFGLPPSGSRAQPHGPDAKHAGSAPVKQDLIRPAVPRKPSFIRIPLKSSEGESTECPPPLPAERPVSGPASQKPRAACKALATPRAPDKVESLGGPPTEKSAPPRPTGGKVPPPRPPTAKGVPVRPPPPRPVLCRSISEVEPHQARVQGSLKKGPALPPRPSPGPLLPGRQGKDEVLIHFEQDDAIGAVCEPADGETKDLPSPMNTVAVPVALSGPGVQLSESGNGQRAGPGLQVEVLHDFTPAGPSELALKTGDVVCKVEKVDSDWYRGTSGGLSGIFPVNHVRVLSCLSAPSSGPTTKQMAATVSGPRCVARFGFDGKCNDELSLCEGDVIRLKEFVDQQWARGDLDGHVGIFPLNFVEIVEDLPDTSSLLRNKKVADPNQAGPAGTEWAVALYNFTAQTDEDLSFQQGEHILITQHVDSDWCSGRLNDKEGLFPKAFVQIRTG